MKNHPNHKNDAALAGTRAAGSVAVWEIQQRPNNTRIDEFLQSDDPAWLTRQPWSGLFRVLTASQRYGWSHLGRHTLRQIKREAKRE